MKWLLNGQFSIAGETYWRIDDMERMEQDMLDGTYDAIKMLSRFDMAVNVKSVPGGAEAMYILVNHLNEWEDPSP